jgi:hypothetical protein
VAEVHLQLVRRSQERLENLVEGQLDWPGRRAEGPVAARDEGAKLLHGRCPGLSLAPVNCKKKHSSFFSQQLHVNAYSAAWQKTAKKVMKRYAEYERKYAEYGIKYAKYAKNIYRIFD